MSGRPVSAADSARGDLYQNQVVFLWSVRRTGAGNDFMSPLEKLDDVTFEWLEANGPKPDELL